MLARLGFDLSRPSQLLAISRSGAGRFKALSYLFSLAPLSRIALARPWLGNESHRLAEEIERGELDEAQTGQSYYRPHKCKKDKIAPCDQGVILAFFFPPFGTSPFLSRENREVVATGQERDCQANVNAMMTCPGRAIRDTDLFRIRLSVSL